MKKVNNAPAKMKGLLVLCLMIALIWFGITFLVYSISRNTAKAVGLDTVPSIIAAQNIKATLANAHSNAMNAMVTGEKLGGKFWNEYRSDLNSLHTQLVKASRGITFGDAERIPLTAISSNISTYEYVVGGAVANGAEISVDQFMEANRLMQQRILPASTALSRVNLEQLERIYGSYQRGINFLIALLIAVGIVFLAVLVMVQIYMFKRTHRVLNLGLVFAAILFAISLIYSTSSLNSIKRDLDGAKKDAFTSINALWNAKSTAYNAKSIQSLYLLHEGTGIVQTADTINFNSSSKRIYSAPDTVSDEGDEMGYLNAALDNMTSKAARTSTEDAITSWVTYVEIDRDVHNFEYDSRHDEAVALSVGNQSGQGNYQFEKFDKALTESININKNSFDDSINSAFKALNIFPYVIIAALLLIAAACILGMKPRLDEYRI